MILLLFRVSARTHPHDVAQMVKAGLAADDGEVILRAIGPRAVNQAVKGVIVARQAMQGEGRDLAVVPALCKVEGDGGTAVAAIELAIKRR
ncbi:MAG: stage V sporulation protein S [Bacillota bacterium]